MIQIDYTEQMINYRNYLLDEEKSVATTEKYLRDVRRFLSFLEGFPKETGINKEYTIAYKAHLSGSYAPASVNSMLIAMNGFLKFCGLSNLCVKLLKIQRQIFCKKEKELTEREYQRLLRASKGTRLFYIIRTIGGTGIRVSELQYITVDAVRTGKADVKCKNKNRIIFLPKEVRTILKEYIAKAGIKKGSVFVTRSGKPLNRSNIWRDMQSLCKRANVSEKKVFPHNLRHLFARTFYGIEKDIVRLADLLGHSSINTTRIYTIESGERHMSCLEKVQKKLTT